MLMINFATVIYAVITNFCTKFVKIFRTVPSCSHSTYKRTHIGTHYAAVLARTVSVSRTFFGFFCLFVATVKRTALSSLDAVKAGIDTIFVNHSPLLLS